MLDGMLGYGAHRPRGKDACVLTLVATFYSRE